MQQRYDLKLRLPEIWVYMPSLLPTRPLFLLAEFCDLILKGLTCRARTLRGTVCKHKRLNGELFCTHHSNIYSDKVALCSSFGERLAIFAEVIKIAKWKIPRLAPPIIPPILRRQVAFDPHGLRGQIERNHNLETFEEIWANGFIYGCNCLECCLTRRYSGCRCDDCVYLRLRRPSVTLYEELARQKR
jgi:hypothetical protein